MNDLKSKLLELGLSDKESSTYLAMLELGPASVQDIAKKAGVNRATAYVMLESLKRRGLMSSVERGKKNLFTPESPERLLSTVAHELQIVEERKARLSSAMPQFMALFNAVEDKPKVRFFEGDEGVAAARDVQQELLTPGQGASVFLHYDASMARAATIEEGKRLQSIRHVGKMRVLYAIEPGIVLPKFERGTDLRRIPGQVAPFKGELNIVETFILIGIPAPRPMSVIIEGADVARLCQSMFDLAWSCAVPTT
ncbi:helix-turn-helix domain-containing protein [Patescibacteria group bacterium]|nr:helix-turn-helix domain-containing protein [Patescibacteria group bacterium]MBU1448392.1 helix-turn-helix domain-containing protein [Patescibacteria group bacterium]MBU2613176.1 helix-turn-helix domain-containing protein [Patescibacteria group bacterium]